MARRGEPLPFVLLKWKIVRGSFVVVVFFYVPTIPIQYCVLYSSTYFLYIYSKQKHNADRGHKKGHALQAQEGHPPTGISRPRTEVLRACTYFSAANTIHCSEAAHRAGTWTCVQVVSGNGGFHGSEISLTKDLTGLIVPQEPIQWLYCMVLYLLLLRKLCNPFSFDSRKWTMIWACAFGCRYRRALMMHSFDRCDSMNQVRYIVQNKIIFYFLEGTVV